MHCQKEFQKVVPIYALGLSRMSALDVYLLPTLTFSLANVVDGGGDPCYFTLHFFDWQ